MAEFFRQGDAEKGRGLPFSMNCDRETVKVNGCQVGFITFLVGPLYKALARYAPELQVCVDQMEKNLKHYKGE